jgi:hypothetical protein
MGQDLMSRREFIGTSALAASAVIVGERGNAQPGAVASARSVRVPSPDQAGLKLGVASYSLRNFSRQQAIEMTRSLRRGSSW